MRTHISIILSIIITFSNINTQEHKFQNKKWKFKTGDRIYSTPVIIEGVVYCGSNDNHLYAVKTNNGEEIWKFRTGGEVRSGITFSEGLVFFGSTDGNYYAIDSKSGKLKWKFETRGENQFDAWDYYLSTPAVSNDIVYFGSGDSTFYALQKKSGELKWEYKTKGVIHSSPVISGNKIYFGSFDGFLYALDLNTGELIWKFDTLGNEYFPYGAIQGSPSKFNKHIYFGSRDYNLYALNAETGKVMWNKSTPSWVIAKPVADTSGLIYFGNSDDPHLYGRNGRYGSLLWEYKISANVFANAVVLEEIVIYGSFNGKLYAIDKKTGKLNFTIQTDASKENYSKIFNDNDEIKEEVASGIKTFDDVIEFYDDLQSLGSVIGSPVIDGNTLYVPSTDGFLYAFD